MLKRLMDILLDMVYPPRCPACRTRVAVVGAWCSTCANRLMAITHFSPVFYGFIALDDCISLYAYKDKLKRVIHDIKFRSDSAKRRQLAWLAEYVLVQNLFSFPIDLVIPVPLDRERLKKRGFNQTELIFREWCGKNRLVWCGDILIRAEKTNPQWKLNRSERLKNLRKAFKVVRAEAVAGKNILLVDDILTTGATLELCARELKKAKARSVTGLALAH